MSHPMLIALPVALPEGYTARPMTHEDAESVAAFQTICSWLEGSNENYTAAGLHEEWQMEHFDLHSASQIVFAPDNTVVGTMIIWDTSSTPVHPWVDWWIHPNEVAKIGDALFAWGEERARQAVDRCPPEARVAMRAGSMAHYAPYENCLQNQGFSRLRYFFRMIIHMTEAPPVPQLPAGISIRTYRHPDELEAVVIARRAAFRDHFGYVELPLEENVKNYQTRLATANNFDATLHFLAVDDAAGEIAGLSLCYPEQDTDDSVGYVATLGVRPEYRKRGLALALLHHTFGEFWRRGRSGVALHVDASNPTGAVRLYERAGMQVDKQFSNFEKELRPGVELANKAE